MLLLFFFFSFSITAQTMQVQGHLLGDEKQDLGKSGTLQENTRSLFTEIICLYFYFISHNSDGRHRDECYM